MLLSNVAAVQFAEFIYSAALAAGALFIPAKKTIIMTAFLTAAQDLSIMWDVQALKSGDDNGANSKGWHGATYCEGTAIGYKNINVAIQTIALYGLTMS